MELIVQMQAPTFSPTLRLLNKVESAFWAEFWPYLAKLGPCHTLTICSKA